MKIYKQLLISVSGGIGLFVIMAIVILYWFGSMGAMMAYLNGHSVYIYPKKIDLNNQQLETKTVVTFYMKNLTSNEISVVGEKSSCTCAFSNKIPITAKPGETIELKVNIHLPEYESVYDQMISFMVAEPKRLAMHPVQITAKIPNPLTKPIDTPISNNAK
jgi:hypothetical protein